MEHLKMVDMARTAEEKAEQVMPAPPSSINEYPYGLAIRLTQDELAKLDLDGDCDVGDMLHGHFLAKVTSVSKNDTEAGQRTMIELQITHMEVDDEEAENQEVDRQSPVKTLYR